MFDNLYTVTTIEVPTGNENNNESSSSPSHTESLLSSTPNSTSSASSRNESPFQSSSSKKTTSYQEISDPRGGIFNFKDVKQLQFSDPATGITLPYCLVLPENYDSKKQYPVLLYLHGAGERGNDNVKQTKNMLQAMYYFAEDNMNNTILVAPQCSMNGWWNLYFDANGSASGELGTVMHLLGEIENTYSSDTNLIYVMGLSMGGYATWTLLSHYPDKFAAGIPICGWGDSSYASALKDVPIWLYHGMADTTVSYLSSKEMEDAIIREGGTKIKSTYLEGVAHNSWDSAATNRELFKWLFSQKLSDR